MEHKESRIQLFSNLIDINQKLLGSAQLKHESIYEYNKKISNLLHNYNNFGKIAQVEFFEITESAGQREKKAIYIYLKGLKSEIKKYICNEKIYKNLYQAQEHARKIETRLKEINEMKIEH